MLSEDLVPVGHSLGEEFRGDIVAKFVTEIGSLLSSFSYLSTSIL